jgi:ubiquinone/menaquinone biosynthesis C-methylase UbiE
MNSSRGLKPGTRLVKKRGLLYPADANGRAITQKRWLGDLFAFLYDRIMEKSIFPKKFSSDLEAHHQIMTAALSSLNGQTVLELGTGSGVAVRWLDPAVEYSGVDVSPGLLKRAARAFRSAGFESVRLYVCDVEDLPFEDEWFDGCLCVLTLNFFPDLDAVVRQVSRVLKADGWFVGCVPVPERNEENRPIQGTLRSAGELEETFVSHGFDFRELPETNGALYYFTARKP